MKKILNLGFTFVIFTLVAQTSFAIPQYFTPSKTKPEVSHLPVEKGCKYEVSYNEFLLEYSINYFCDSTSEPRQINLPSNNFNSTYTNYNYTYTKPSYDYLYTNNWSNSWNFDNSFFNFKLPSFNLWFNNNYDYTNYNQPTYTNYYSTFLSPNTYKTNANYYNDYSPSTWNNSSKYNNYSKSTW